MQKLYKTLFLLFFFQNLQAQTIVSSDAVFYDDGGKDGHLIQSYQKFQYAAEPGKKLRLFFTELNLPEGAQMKVYEGLQTNNTKLIASFSSFRKSVNIEAPVLTIEYVGPKNRIAPGWVGVLRALGPKVNKTMATKPESDCLGAIPLCSNSTVNTSVNQYEDTGNVNDDAGGCYSGTGAGGSVWYSFTPQANGPLDFTITPTGSTDYDFVLWDITGGCASKTEVSCNFAAPSGPTGISSTGAATNSQDASGTRFNQRVTVDMTHRYAICINYYSGNNDGFTLTFKNEASSVNIVDNIPPTITNAYGNGCASSNQVEVFFSEYLDCNTLQATDFSIPGHTISLITTNCSGGTPNKTNRITLGVNPPLLGPATYTLTGVTVNDLCGNPLNSNYNLVFGAAPTVSTGPAQIVCRSTAYFFGIPVGFNYSTVTLTASGATTYFWSDGQTGSSINVSPTANTTYTVTGQNGACSATATVNVTVEVSPEPNLGADRTICAGDQITLNATGGGTYQWQVQTGTNIFGQPTYSNIAGATNSSLTTIPVPFGAGTTTNYRVNVASPSGVCSGSDAIRITFNPSPTVSAGLNKGVCSGGSVTLDGSHTGTSVAWSPTTNLSCTNCATPIASPAVTTTYTMTSTGANGCQARANVTVTVQDGASAVISGPANVCSGGTATLTSTILNAGTAPTYQWYLNGAPIAGATNTTYTSPALVAGSTYYLVVTPGGTGQCNNNQVYSNTLFIPVLTCTNISTTSTTYNTCAGTIYDNGGAASNYSDGSASYSAIINPGQPFSINFSQFTLFNDADQVRLYNCNTAGCTANQIGAAYQTTNSPGTVNINNNNGLRIVFQVTNSNIIFSDAAAGFAATWTTNPILCPGSIIGPNTLNPVNAGIHYSVNPIAGATNYIWTVPPGVTISAGQGTNDITISSASANSGNVTCTVVNNCTSCSYVLPVTVTSILPVDQIILHAKSFPNNIHLSWESINESQILGYQIQKSIDGVNFYNVHFSDVSTKEYDDFDLSIGTGKVYYYRIVAIDLNQTQYFSNIVFVHIYSELWKVQLFPNPASESISISQENISGPLTIEMFNILGQSLEKRSFETYNTTLTTEFQIKNLNPGQYFIKISSDKGIKRLSFIKN